MTHAVRYSAYLRFQDVFRSRMHDMSILQRPDSGELGCNHVHSRLSVACFNDWRTA